MKKLLSKFKKISRIGVTPPEPEEGRHGLAIAAIVKDEAPYIAEWIEYHRLVGVRKFYIYDNGSVDDTIKIAQHHIGDDGLVLPFVGNFFDERLGRPIDSQSLAYVHAIANFGGQFRWMCFIDPDEFIVPKGGDNVADILAEHFEGEVNISLPWKMFGTSGHVERVEGLTTEHFTKSYNGKIYPLNRYPFKYFVDPTEVTSLSAHAANTRRDKDLSSNDRGEKMRNNKRNNADFCTMAHFQLNHYYTRSENEMRDRKLTRGRFVTQGSHYKDNAMLQALELLDQNAEPNDEIARFVEPLAARLSKKGPVK